MPPLFNCLHTFQSHADPSWLSCFLQPTLCNSFPLFKNSSSAPTQYKSVSRNIPLVRFLFSDHPPIKVLAVYSFHLHSIPLTPMFRYRYTPATLHFISVTFISLLISLCKKSSILSGGIAASIFVLPNAVRWFFHSHTATLQHRQKLMPATNRTQSTLLGVLSGYRRTFHGFLAQLPSNSICLFQTPIHPSCRPGTPPFLSTLPDLLSSKIIISTIIFCYL